MTHLSTKEKVFLFIGMTFFWSYFRFQTVVQTLFHKAEVVPIFGYESTAITVFLMTMVLVAAVAAFAANKVSALVCKYRGVLLVLACLGTLGILLNYYTGSTAQGSVLTGVLFWVSTLFFVLGFISNILGWGNYCSRKFGLEMMVLLAFSFVVSLIMFSYIGMYAPNLKRLLVPLIPPVVQLTWFLAATEADKGERAAAAAAAAGKGRGAAALATSERQKSSTLPKSKLIYILLFVAFLLCGSLIRGIVDMQNQYSNILQFRLYTSVVAVTMIAVYCVYRKHCFDTSIEQQQAADLTHEPLTAAEIEQQENAEIERLTLKCWAFLALVFFCGLFWEFAFSSVDYGGQLVVVARSGLDFLLWTLLCNIVHSENLHSTRVFIVFVVLVEVCSWLLSYTMIPYLYTSTGAAMAGADSVQHLVETLLVLVMFLMVGALTFLFAWIALRKQNMFDSARTTAATAIVTPAQGLADLARQFKLTSREQEVLELFSQGYSLSKVAQELYISLGTAQSHIKNIYRKLDVHSKDELISLIDGYHTN